MGTLAIGDIHGNRAALDDLLNRIAPEISPVDTVVFLGDYIDRGPDSKGCIQSIIDFRNSVKSRVETLLGNHEEWLLRTYQDHTLHSWLLGMDAFQTIRSYSANAAARLRDAAKSAGPRLVFGRVRLPYEIFFEAVPDEHIEFLTSLRVFCRTPDALCVHGGLDPAAGVVGKQMGEDLIWGTGDFPEHYRGEIVVVYGHADNAVLDRRGMPSPRILGRTYGLDTISHGVLTALRLPEGVVIQSGRHS